MRRIHSLNMLELSDAFPDDRTAEHERAAKVAEAAVVLARAVSFDIETYQKTEHYN